MGNARSLSSLAANIITHFTNSASVPTGAAHPIVQPTLVLNKIIKT